VDCAGFEWWCFDQFVLGDVFAWFVHVYDCVDVVHGDWSDERHFVFVHGDRDQCQRDQSSFDCLGRCGSVDGAWCSDFAVGDFECEWSVGCVVDCADFDWWCFDLLVHGDLFAWFIHVYLGDAVVHGVGSDERDVLYVHGDSDQCVWYWCGFDCEFCCCSVDGAGRTDFSSSDCRCEQPVGCFVDCTGFDWWCRDHFVHGDVGSGCFHVHDCLDVVHGDWSDEWDELHVHGDCDECVRNWFGLNGLCVDRSFDGAGCTDFGFGDFECERIVGCVVDCTGFDWWCLGQFVHGDVFAWFVHVYVGDAVVHGVGSDERDVLYVHGDSDQCVWCWCGFDFEFGCDTVDGAGCSDFGVGDFECERIVGCVVDCTGFDWWCFDHFVHGDVVAGFFHVHDCVDVVHGVGSDERDEIHVHGDRNECEWDRLGLDDEFGRGSVDGARCADGRGRDWWWEWSVGGFVDCPIE